MAMSTRGNENYQLVEKTGENMYENEPLQSANLQKQRIEASQWTNSLYKKPTSELKSPAPCPGSKASSAESSPTSNQNSAQLKDEIMKEIKAEIGEPFKKMLSNILDEIQTLKLRFDTVNAITDLQTKSNGNEYVMLEVDSNPQPPTERESSLHFPAEHTNNSALGTFQRDASSGKQLSSTYDINLNLLKKTMKSRDQGSPDSKTQCSTAVHPRKGSLTTVDKKPIPSPRPDVNNYTLPSSNKLHMLNRFPGSSSQTRGQVVQVKPRPKSVQLTRGCIPSVKNVDDRQCLANAIQFHVEDLANGLLLSDRELSDSLVREGCLTEYEFGPIKQIPCREDKIRVIISIVKGRDQATLEGFMKLVNQHNPAVAIRITETFESGRNAVEGKLCALCQLERQCDVKHVIDSLWSIRAIDDSFYNEIIHSDAPIGVQSTFWRKIFFSINCMNRQTAEQAHIKLMTAFSRNDQVAHLQNEIEEMLFKNQGKFVCLCQQDRMSNSESVVLPASEDSVSSSSSSTPSWDLPLGISSRDRKQTVFASVGRTSKTSKESNKKTMSESSSPDGLKTGSSHIKIPALPKRHSFTHKAVQENQSLQICNKSKDPPNMAKTTCKSKVAVTETSNYQDSHKGDSTETTFSGPQTNDEEGQERHCATSTPDGAPSLPEKKNKHSSWGKANDQAQYYV